MQKLKKVKTTVEAVEDVICNKCGKSCLPHKKALNYEHAHVCVNWGYDSKKDLEQHEWDLCEKCYDDFVKTFKHKPKKNDYLEDSSEKEDPYPVLFKNNKLLGKM